MSTVMIINVLCALEGNLRADKGKYHVLGNKHMGFLNLDSKTKNTLENI